MGAVTLDERREQMRRNLKIAFMMGDNDPEIKNLLDKVLPLRHEFREGKLYVGSALPAKWELRESKTGTKYCKCPAFAFRSRPGRGDGLCKHLIYALASGLDIPKTEDLVAK
jgi:hypothetical protein